MKEPKTGIHKKTWWIVLCSVLAILLAGAVVVTILTESALDQIQRPKDPTLSSSEIEDILSGDPANGTDPAISEEDIDLGGDPADIIHSEDLINILLIGQDASTSADWKKSDAMILCTINKKAKTMTLTSFLRDMYVTIPNYYRQRINVAYQLGGFKTLNDTLEHNFGVRADHCVEVDFSGFRDIVNVLGGVDIRLTAEEAAYLNQHGNGGITDHKGWKLKAGENSLTPEQAMGYARLQSVGGEMERTGRQRKVISALVEKAKSMSAAELYDLVKTGLGMITTDMTDEEILGLVTELTPVLPGLTLANQRIPVDGSYSIQNVERIGNCAVLDFEANRKFLVDILKP